jgi:formyltetrahydrofolate hydrolase
MAKLDTIIENQQEQNLLLRQIAASSLSSGSGDTLDELIPSKMDSIEELLEFEEKLQDTEFKKKMVICLFVLTAHCIYNIIMKHWTYKRL